VLFSDGQTTGPVSNVFTNAAGVLTVTTVGTVLSYVFYWLAVIVVLVYLKFKEVTYLTFSLNS